MASEERARWWDGGPWGAVGAMSAVLTMALSVQTWYINVLIDQKITDHTAVPHAVTLQRTQELVADMTMGDMGVKDELQADVQGMKIEQAGFKSDIAWIKAHITALSQQINQVLENQR